MKELKITFCTQTCCVLIKFEHTAIKLENNSLYCVTDANSFVRVLQQLRNISTNSKEKIPCHSI